jgi:hypothetical protein
MLIMPNAGFRWPDIVFIMTPTPMKRDFLTQTQAAIPEPVAGSHENTVFGHPAAVGDPAH